MEIAMRLSGALTVLSVCICLVAAACRDAPLPNVVSVLKSKGLGGSGCVHPSDFETFLRLYVKGEIDSHIESMERSEGGEHESHSLPVAMIPTSRPGFTVTMRYDFPGLTFPVQLADDRMFVRPGESIRACGFSVSDDRVPSSEIAKNACMDFFMTRNPVINVNTLWFVGPTIEVARTCIIWVNREGYK